MSVVLAYQGTEGRLVKLVTARVLKGWTQAQLAREAGVSPVTIVKLEAHTKSRVKRPHPRTIKAIATALDVRPEVIDEFRAALGLPPE